MPSLNLVVLRCGDIDRTKAFYEILGLAFTRESHGAGPAHYCHQDERGVLELYPAHQPASENTGLGFAVHDLEPYHIRFTEAGLAPGAITQRGWGKSFVVRDPDKRRIEVTQESTMPRPLVSAAIQRLPHGADLPLPAYQSADSAGMDLHAAVAEPLTLAPGQLTLVPCGFAMALPAGYEGQVRPRSGLAVKHAIVIPNSPGTIDADYRGEVKAALLNLGQEAFVITRGMRIAQLVVMPVPRVQWVEQAELPATQRGAGGFGHTGS